MYNIIISVFLGAITYVAIAFAASLSWWVAFIAATVVMLGSFYLISRIIMKKVEAIISGAMKDLQTQRVSSREMQVQLVDRAIKEMHAALQYEKWQIYVGGQINASIGMLYYIKRDFNSAFPYLQKGFFKNWVTMGMLGVYYLKKNKKGLMKETFEKAVIGSPKESLLWALYAYCLCESGEQDRAKEVLEKGLKKISGDENLSLNLSLLKEGKRMKMAGYGETWYQFHLENTASLQKQQQMASMTGGMKRKVVRR
jgi:tetratricopeptide (TPR) repeat protein